MRPQFVAVGAAAPRNPKRRRSLGVSDLWLGVSHVDDDRADVVRSSMFGGQRDGQVGRSPAAVRRPRLDEPWATAIAVAVPVHNVANQSCPARMRLGRMSTGKAVGHADYLAFARPPLVRRRLCPGSCFHGLPDTPDRIFLTKIEPLTMRADHREVPMQGCFQHVAAGMSPQNGETKRRHALDRCQSRGNVAGASDLHHRAAARADQVHVPSWCGISSVVRHIASMAIGADISYDHQGQSTP